MAIQLRWSNQNAPGNILNIYRNEGDTITEASKGTPIATLDSAATTYNDTTTIPGLTYSYLVEIVAPLGTVYSRPTTTANLRRIGPGGSEILSGNSEFGYMGIVPASQMPDFWTTLDFSIGRIVPHMNNLVWHKFVRKNKIMIVPNMQPTTRYYNDNDQWLNGLWVYHTYGLASGLEWNFDTSAAKYASWARKRIVKFGNDSFHLRAPRAYMEDWDGVHDLAKTLDPNTEVNQLMQAMYQGNIIGNNVGNVSGLITIQGFMRFVCAEMTYNGSVPSQSESIMKNMAPREDNFAVVSEWLGGVPINNSFNTFGDQIVFRWRHAGCPTFFPVFEYIEE